MEHRHSEGYREHRIEMMTSVPSHRAARRRRAPLAGLVVFVIGLLLVFGTMEQHLSRAQDDGGGTTETNAVQGETNVNAEEQCVEGEEYPVTLNDVTWKDRIKWAAQAVVAPERLSELIPIYTYVYADVRDPIVNDEIYIGFAMVRDINGNEEWRVRPLPPRDINASSDIGECYLASSSPILDQHEAGRFWVSEKEWERGLEQVQAIVESPATWPE